jgi:hypothetical protein
LVGVIDVAAAGAAGGGCCAAQPAIARTVANTKMERFIYLFSLSIDVEHKVGDPRFLGEIGRGAAGCAGGAAFTLFLCVEAGLQPRGLGRRLMRAAPAPLVAPPAPSASLVTPLHTGGLRLSGCGSKGEPRRGRHSEKGQYSSTRDHFRFKS